ncbi:MAG: polysaccharide deacetylase [Eubacteriales bacterium]|nr:polysaccharide deacetylase [Eubacteriales bacterium]
MKRARQRRQERADGSPAVGQQRQSRRQSRNGSVRKPAEGGFRPVRAAGTRRQAAAAEKGAAQKNAPGGSAGTARAAGTRRQAAAAEKGAAQKNAPGGSAGTARAYGTRRQAASAEKGAARKNAVRKKVHSRGIRAARKSPVSRRGPFVPFVLAILLLLCVLFVFPGVVPRVFRWYSETYGRDTTPPVIELNSDPDYVVYPGQEYEEEGYTASDDRDGDLTEKVSRTVEEDRICYRVSDEAGNSTVLYRRIPYAEVSSNIRQGYSSAEELAKMRESFRKAETDASGSGKIIYLTFDDGPGQYTERLLDILERNNVHVTFFVTGAFPAYEDLIHKEYEAGHSIGIHSFSHDYDKIYADEDAFWKDIGKMQEIVVRQTGYATNLMRFAGGSSNTMGTWQKPGIMEHLVKQAPKKGFQYFDWNVSSGDGSAEGDSAMVISKITEQIQNFDESVVLCHDTKEYTVNAMEYLIPWLLDRGYTILPLSSDSEPAHHLEG